MTAHYHKVSQIKRSQRESALLRVIAPFFLEVIQEHPAIAGLSVTKVALSRDKSSASVYFYHPDKNLFVNKALPLLKLYKPSLRKAIATAIPARYTCDVRFVYDEKFEQMQHLETLLHEISHEHQSDDSTDLQ